MDTGGDDAGALVIGRYRREIRDDEAVLYFVINCFRPETSNISGVLEILEEIKKSSGMDVDFLINNSHLMNHTTPGDIVKGIEFAHSISMSANIPIAFHAFMTKNDIVVHDLKEPVLWMKRIINFPDIVEMENLMI